MTDTPTPGQVNYEAYMAHMPVRAAYASLHTSTRRAWEAAAQAVLTQAGLLVLDLDPEEERTDA